jgi:hypothetical protein
MGINNGCQCQAIVNEQQRKGISTMQVGSFDYHGFSCNITALCANQYLRNHATVKVGDAEGTASLTRVRSRHVEGAGI